MLEKKALGTREIERRKKLASKYKGISYDVKKNLFTVRVSCGTDLKGRTIYVQPIRSYNCIDEAVECLNKYRELVEIGMGRPRKVTFKIIHKELKEARKALIEDCKENPTSKKAIEGKAPKETIEKYCQTLDLIRRGAPLLYEKDLRKVEKGEIQSVYEQIYTEGLPKEKGSGTVAERTINDRFKRISAIIGDGYGLNKSLFKIKKISEIQKDRNKQLSEENKTYTMEELSKMYKTATIEAKTFRGKHNTADRTRLLFILLVCTGARIGELLNVSVDKVIHKNDKNGYTYETTDGRLETIKMTGVYYIVINRQSNDITRGEALAKTAQSNRMIPIFKELYDEIQEYAKRHNLSGKDKLFFASFSSSKKDIAMLRTNVNSYILKLQKNAGVERINGRASHEFRDSLMTRLETLFCVRENVVRFFVGHTGRGDAHSGYVKITDDMTLKKASIEFVCAQASYYYGIVNGLSSEEMDDLNEAFKEWSRKRNLTKKELREAYTELNINKSFNGKYRRFMTGLGYGDMANSLDCTEYHIHRVEVDDAVEYYKNQSYSFRSEVTLKEFVDKWMNDYYKKYDEWEREDFIDDVRGFYESMDEEFKNSMSFDRVLLDIEEKNSIMYKMYTEYMNERLENSDF